MARVASKPVAKKKVAAKPVKKVAAAKGKRVRTVSAPPTKKAVKLSKTTGFREGTDEDLIARELLKGGESRVAIAHRIIDLEIVPMTTRNGTPKQVNTIMAAVIGKLEARGSKVVSSYKMTRPTL